MRHERHRNRGTVRTDRIAMVNETQGEGRWRECSAEFHVPECPCIRCPRTNCDGCTKTNVDHFTPRCIIRKNHNHFNSKTENLQWLSIDCHRDKDSSTPSRVRNTVFNNVDSLKDWIDTNDFKIKEDYYKE